MQRKNISCIIIDDEPLSVSLLEGYIGDCKDIDLKAKFTNPIEALHFLTHTTVDFIFLDIQMPELTGIQFMNIIQKKKHVILTTAYPEYALNAFDMEAADYLLKPISFERFKQSIRKISEIVNAVQNRTVTEALYFFVKSEYKTLKINYEDVLYFEGLRDYVAIHTNEQKILTLQNLKDFEETLPTNRFIRIHKSYIINLLKIKSIKSNKIILDRITLPIGSTYEKRLKLSLAIS